MWPRPIDSTLSLTLPWNNSLIFCMGDFVTGNAFKGFITAVYFILTLALEV